MLLKQMQKYKLHCIEKLKYDHYEIIVIMYILLFFSSLLQTTVLLEKSKYVLIGKEGLFSLNKPKLKVLLPLLCISNAILSTLFVLPFLTSTCKNSLYPQNPQHIISITKVSRLMSIQRQGGGDLST